MWPGQRSGRESGADGVKAQGGAWYKALQAVGRTLAFILSENTPGFFPALPFLLRGALWPIRPGWRGAFLGCSHPLPLPLPFKVLVFVPLESKV